MKIQELQYLRTHLKTLQDTRETYEDLWCALTVNEEIDKKIDSIKNDMIEIESAVYSTILEEEKAIIKKA